MSKILIVDDERMSREFLAMLLGYFHHETLEAGDGVEALESVRTGGIDLVIADVLMPTMDGYDFLQRLRADRVFGSTPVIFYTAVDYEPEARAMAEACGVRHFLTKPTEPHVIVAAINSVLGHETTAVSPVSLNKFNRHVVSAPAHAIDPDAIVFVVDNDRASRHSLSETIGQACLKVAAFATAEEFLENYDVNQPGCLVLDLRLPGISGIALLEILRSRRNHIPAIVLTGHGDMADAIQAMRLRVLDFLENPADRRILLAKIYRALQEDSIRRRDHAEAEAIRQRMAALTAREHDLVKLLILGKTSKEIASELRISVRTVSHHRAHLMAKTQATNLADLVRMSMAAVDKK